MSPADLADNADKPQNYKTTITTPPQTVFLCEIMQLCCIHLRNLRHLRENIHARVLNLLAQMEPNISHADNRRQTTKLH